VPNTDSYLIHKDGVPKTSSELGRMHQEVGMIVCQVAFTIAITCLGNKH
jgi:hypothetical protein